MGAMKLSTVDCQLSTAYSLTVTLVVVNDALRVT